MSKILANCTGFDWDEGNSDKNWIQHHVSDSECEEVFFNRPLIVGDDKKHSATEKRYYVLGRTDTDRYLFVAFTIRNNLIRIISARDMNNKEIRKYHEKIKRDSKI
ncbi:MAG: BrnT family toxin [bacterium]